MQIDKKKSLGVFSRVFESYCHVGFGKLTSSKFLIQFKSCKLEWAFYRKVHGRAIIKESDS